MSRNGAESSVAEILRDVDIKDRELHDASWEDDLISGRVVVGIDSWDTHLQQC